MDKINKYSGLQQKAIENPYFTFDKKKQKCGASKRVENFELYLVCRIAASGPSFWHLQIWNEKATRKEMETMGNEILSNVGVGSICFEYMPKVVFYRQMSQAELDEVDKKQRQIETDVLSIFKYNDKLAENTKRELSSIYNKTLEKLSGIEGMDSCTEVLEELQAKVGGLVSRYKVERSRIEAKLDKLE